MGWFLRSHLGFQARAAGICGQVPLHTGEIAKRFAMAARDF